MLGVRNFTRVPGHGSPVDAVCAEEKQDKGKQTDEVEGIESGGITRYIVGDARAPQGGFAYRNGDL
jgi:hypothetical protein